MTKTNNYHHDAARCLGGFSMHCSRSAGRCTKPQSRHVQVGTAKERLRFERGMAQKIVIAPAQRRLTVQLSFTRHDLTVLGFLSSSGFA